jgi:hypothetical protein
MERNEEEEEESSVWSAPLEVRGGKSHLLLPLPLVSPLPHLYEKMHYA